MPRYVQWYGWVPDMPDPRDFMYAAPAAVLQQLPPSQDLRPSCPPVYDQGSVGSCTGNAIGGAFEFEQGKLVLQQFVPSRLFIYYNERVREGTGSGQRRSHPRWNQVCREAGRLHGGRVALQH
jgi:hypothetical protein